MTKKILVDEAVLKQALDAIGAFQRGEACEHLFLDVHQLITDAQQANDMLSSEPLGFWLTGTELVEFVRCDYHDGPEWEPIYTHQAIASADGGSPAACADGDESDHPLDKVEQSN